MNAVNNDGVTALHEAVLRNDAKLVEELLVRGANPDLKATSGPSAGKSPKDLSEGNADISALMEKASKLPLAPAVKSKVPAIDDQTPSELSGGDTEDIQETSDADASSLSPVRMVNGNAAPSAAPPSEPEPVLLDSRLNLLWPKPQQISQKEGPALKLPKEFSIKIAPSASGANLEKQVDIWTIQTAMLQDLGFKPTLGGNMETEDATIVCIVNQQLFNKKESYRMVVTESEVKLIASDIAGLWYASCTLLSLVRLYSKEGIPQLKISDWPSLAHRAVMLDMSAGRIRNIDYLLFQVNTLSMLKFNELHFYIKVDKNSDPKEHSPIPYTPSELLDLEVYCNYRFVTLVPHIDATPDLQLTPDTFRIFRHALSLFSNNHSVNIGPNLTSKLLTETVDLGATAGEAEKSWSMSLEDKLSLMGVKQEDTVMFCTNEVDLSNKIQFPIGSIGIHYGTRDSSDFITAGKNLCNNGIGFMVSPGTATWNSIGGSPETTIRNILNATKCRHGNSDAVGLMVVKWAGKIFLDSNSLGWPGLVTAAGCAWNTAVNEAQVHANLAQVINHLVYQDPDCTLGDVILEMGKACTLLNKTFCNAGAIPENGTAQPMDGGSFLCQLCYRPDDVDLTHMTSEVAQKVMLRMRKCQSSLKKGSKIPFNATDILELHLLSDIILWGAKLTRSLVIAGAKPNDGSSVGSKVINPGIANLNATTKTDCANKLLSLMEEHRTIWLKTYRPSGLLVSLSIFSSILDKLVPKQAT